MFYSRKERVRESERKGVCVRNELMARSESERESGGERGVERGRERGIERNGGRCDITDIKIRSICICKS